MAINKYMHAAVKAITHVDLDIKSNYKLIRQLERVVKKPLIKITYQTWDSHIKNGDYDIPIRIYNPSGEKVENFTDLDYPVILFFHGGGWVTGDLDSYDKVCIAAARQTEHMVIAVDYRLAPENPFPIGFTDCCQALETILHWPQCGDGHKVTLMGDSAGGNLAAAVSLWMRDQGKKMADRQILIYPAAYNDHSENSPFPSIIENGTEYLLTSKRVCDYMDLYCGETIERNSPYLAPLLADDFSNQPDTLVITAEFDPLRDEGEAYGQKLEDAGNNVQVHRIADALHGYFTLPVNFTIVKETYQIIQQFLHEDAANE